MGEGSMNTGESVDKSAESVTAHDDCLRGGWYHPNPGRAGGGAAHEEDGAPVRSQFVRVQISERVEQATGIFRRPSWWPLHRVEHMGAEHRVLVR
jgi:hypothetical protein